MEYKEIPFNYFIQIFQEKCQKKYLELEKNRIGELDELYFLFDVLNGENIPQEEKILIYKDALYDTCLYYLSLSNTDINVMPQNVLELVDLILNLLQDDPEKELFLQEEQMNTCNASFLYSLQYIYQYFFDCLGFGHPMLTTHLDAKPEDLPALEITLSSRNEILNCESVKMDLIEQDKILTKIISMECNHQLGPIPQVRMRIRKDI